MYDGAVGREGPRKALIDISAISLLQTRLVYSARIFYRLSSSCGVEGGFCIIALVTVSVSDVGNILTRERCKLRIQYVLTLAQLRGMPRPGHHIALILCIGGKNLASEIFVYRLRGRVSG